MRSEADLSGLVPKLDFLEGNMSKRHHSLSLSERIRAGKHVGNAFVGLEEEVELITV